MNKNDVYKIEIEKLDHQGRGIGHINNYVVFIANALVGEIVEAKITYIKKNIAEGEVVKYLKKSSKRVNPNCPYYDNCGGCDLMHISYDDQLDYKKNKIKEILKRYSDIEIDDLKITPSIELNYRNKITLQVKEKIGLYKKKSYEIIPIDKCLLVSNRVNDIIVKLKDCDLKNIEKIVIRSSYENAMVAIYAYDTFDKSILSRLDNVEAISWCIKNKWYFKGNKSKIIENLGDFSFYISPTSFFQVNSYIAVKLYDKVKTYAELSGNENVLDLYCGTGTIGIYLSKEAKKIIGIEINKDAVKDAKENAKLNNVDNIEFIADDVSNAIEKIKEKINVIVVDPPRSGLDQNTINYILELNPKKIIYVSCDPMTMARDLKTLKQYYNLKDIELFDMFPNTYHVECISVLKQK